MPLLAMFFVPKLNMCSPVDGSDSLIVVPDVGEAVEISSVTGVLVPAAVVLAADIVATTSVAAFVVVPSNHPSRAFSGIALPILNTLGPGSSTGWSGNWTVNCRTCIVNDFVSVFWLLLLSVSLQSTPVVPTLNELPDAGMQVAVTVTSTKSVPVGVVYVTGTLDCAVLTIMLLS